MEQIYAVAFEYYARFYSLKGYYRKLWLWVFGSVVFGFAFLVSFVLFIVSLKGKELPLGVFGFLSSISYVLFFEVLFLCFYFVLKSKHNNELTKGFEGGQKMLEYVLLKKTGSTKHAA